GEAVVGRRLQQVRLGVDVGRRLDKISPRLAIQGRYSFAFVEQVLDVPNNRSNGSLVASYQLLGDLSLQALVTGQVTHGGLNAPPGLPTPPNPGQIEAFQRFLQHDRVMNDDNLRPGL